MSQFGGNYNQNERVTRFIVKDGKFVHFVKEGENEQLDWLNGRLVEIKLREFQQDNITMTYCDTIFRLDDGQKFSVSTIASSSITADIISRLANVKNYEDVLVLKTWMNDKYTNIAIREKKTFDIAEEGEKLPFIKMPPVKKVTNGFNTSMDSSERDNKVKELIDQINAKLKGVGTTAVAEETGDLPEGPEPPLDYEPKVF